MNVVVCIKQVPDPICRFTISSPPKSVNEEGLVYVVNPHDLLAVEEGLRLREQRGQGQVIVVTLGPPRSEHALRKCLAMGADQAMRLWDDALEGSDTYVTALLLAQAIKALSYDLILCGAQTADGATAQVGPMLAEFLGLPQVTGVTKLDCSVDERTITAQRRLERGDREVVECGLPAVITVQSGANEPRYPLLSLRKKASATPIKRLGLAELGLSLHSVGTAGSLVELVNVATPRPKPKKIFTPDSTLSAEERLRLLMSGGVTEKKGEFIEGTPDQIAGQVIEHLKAEKVL